MSAVAVLSLKGGVGKSTTVLGLAGAAWARGIRVLVIDLDPQANATVALDPPPFAFTIGDVLGGYDHGYPERIVDHATERIEALDRFAAMKAARA